MSKTRPGVHGRTKVAGSVGSCETELRFQRRLQEFTYIRNMEYLLSPQVVSRDGAELLIQKIKYISLSSHTKCVTGRI